MSATQAMVDVGGSLEKSADKLSGTFFEAMTQVSNAIASPSSGSTSRAAAISVIQENDLLSDNEMLEAYKFIRKNPDDAEVIVAIKKPILRVRYLRSRLEDQE
jgi:hypothetical protein